MSARPIAFVDKVGNVSTHDHSRLQKLLAELPDAPVGEPILALYDAATISQVQAEIARLREALKQAQDISGSLWHSSRASFGSLSDKHYRDLRKVLFAALGGSNDKG